MQSSLHRLLCREFLSLLLLKLYKYELLLGVLTPPKMLGRNALGLNPSSCDGALAKVTPA